MCKNGRCGHFDDPQIEQQFFASLEPVLLNGKKLKIAVTANEAVDRVHATQVEEREELLDRLDKQHSRNEIKISDAMRQVEVLANRHKLENKNALKLYTEALDKAVAGTHLAGLFSKSNKDKKALAQIDLNWASTLGIGIAHRNPDAVRGENQQGDEFTFGDVPDFIRDIGQRLAAATGGKLAGIIAVPKG